MKSQALIFLALFSVTAVFAYPNTEDPIEQAKKAAEQFIQAVDKSDTEQLRTLLHQDLVQFARLNGALMAFKTQDFIQMIGDKKIGGVTRTISHQSAQLIRGEAVDVTLNAVSSEYDFMYQIALAKSEGKWMIVGILVDIVKL